MTGAAQAAEVKGSLVLADYRGQTQEATSPVPSYRWELENGLMEVLPDHVPARELAVVLLSDTPRDSQTLDVPIWGGELLPSTLAVREGDTLSLTNRDDVPHAVTATGVPGFSADAIAAGGKRAVNLATAGSWLISDSLTPHARGHVHVLANLFAMAEVGPDATFLFNEIPPGDYTLQVLHGASVVATTEIKVSGRVAVVAPLTPQAPR